MLDNDKKPLSEGSGTMLFQALKSLLMVMPQSSSFSLLQDRLVTTSRFRQSVIHLKVDDEAFELSKETELLVNRVLDVRDMHCDALWETIRVESLETTLYESKEEEKEKTRSVKEETRETGVAMKQKGKDSENMKAPGGETQTSGQLSRYRRNRKLGQRT